jgi:RNA polymerase sigma-70 factor (ECF subfamily)
LNDQLLIEKLRAGDQTAFRDMVEARQGLVYNTVIGFLQHPEDAEDVTQEVFIKVFESIGQFKGESAFTTWLYRIAVTSALEFLRKKSRKKRSGLISRLFGDDNTPLSDPADFVHPGVKLDQRENARLLFEAMRMLPENQRIAFTLHKVEGLSYQEVASIMAVSVSAVESLFHRAKQNLKKTLEKTMKD